MKHGTLNAYVNHNCRCDSCRMAMSAYGKRKRAAHPERAKKHREREAAKRRAAGMPMRRVRQCGTSYTYQCGCRCVRCTAAANAHNRKMVANRRAAGQEPGKHGTRYGYDEGCRCELCKHSMFLSGKRHRKRVTLHKECLDIAECLPRQFRAAAWEAMERAYDSYDPSTRVPLRAWLTSKARFACIDAAREDRGWVHLGDSKTTWMLQTVSLQTPYSYGSSEGDRYEKEMGANLPENHQRTSLWARKDASRKPKEPRMEFEPPAGLLTEEEAEQLRLHLAGVGLAARAARMGCCQSKAAAPLASARAKLMTWFKEQEFCVPRLAVIEAELERRRVVMRKNRGDQRGLLVGGMA